METKEAFSTIVNIVCKIEETDSNIIDITNKLKIVLLNLKIENSRIREHTGIQPIADELDKNIKRINESLNSLVRDNRDQLTEALNTLSEYIEREEVKNEER